MSKNSESSRSSRSSRSSGNKKRHKHDRLCSHCYSSDKKYLDTDCKTYFQNNPHLKHTDNETDIPELNDYLNERQSMFEKLIHYSLNTEKKDCIKIDSDNNKLFINNENIELSNIEISKYISTGCYGIIFVSSKNEGIKYVIKFIKKNDENQNEIKAMINIRNNNINKIPNYINIVNYHLDCNSIQNKTNQISVGINKCFKSDSYAMIILEYFDGNIFDLLNNIFPLFPLNIPINNIDIFYSIFAQLLLSIYLFHNKFNYYHKDAHLKNFLYKKVNVNEPDVYLHYKINDTNYYIKNCGYIVVLADYGLSTEITEPSNNNLLFEDYEDIICKLFSYNKKIKHLNDIKTNFIKSSFDEFSFLDKIMEKYLCIKKEKNGITLINEKSYE